MIRDLYGIDLLDLLVRQSLGNRVLEQVDAGLRTAAKVSQHAAIWFGLPPATGTVTAVRGAAGARGLPGVVAVTVLKEPGDRVVARAGDSLGRIVSARSVADDPFEALRRARAAAESVIFSIDAPAVCGDVPPETGV
jgi:hypothetical protein